MGIEPCFLEMPSRDLRGEEVVGIGTVGAGEGEGRGTYVRSMYSMHIQMCGSFMNAP